MNYRGPVPPIPSCGHPETTDGCDTCAELAKPIRCGHTQRDVYDAPAGRQCRVCGELVEVAITFERVETHPPDDEAAT